LVGTDFFRSARTLGAFFLPFFKKGNFVDTMCYTAAKKIAEGLALPALNEEGLPRGLPRLMVTLPPRGHGRGGPIVEPPVQPGPGEGGRLATLMAFNAQPGPDRRAIPVAFLQTLQQQIGRSRN